MHCTASLCAPSLSPPLRAEQGGGHATPVEKASELTTAGQKDSSGVLFFPAPAGALLPRHGAEGRQPLPHSSINAEPPCQVA